MQMYVRMCMHEHTYVNTRGHKRESLSLSLSLSLCVCVCVCLHTLLRLAVTMVSFLFENTFYRRFVLQLTMHSVWGVHEDTFCKGCAWEHILYKVYMKTHSVRGVHENTFCMRCTWQHILYKAKMRARLITHPFITYPFITHPDSLGYYAGFAQGTHIRHTYKAYI